ncbi:MAG TPA: peptidase A24 [Methanocorpusculum sp.]|nr:peptidase A24 [Methanocorpusculum sp.]
MDLPFILLTISALAVLLTFLIASYQDLRSRTVYTLTWYPAAVVCAVCIIWFWILKFTPAALPILILSILIAVLMAAFTIFGLFGKADAKAMILLSIAVPVTPFAAYVFPSLAVSSIINAGLIVLLISLVLLLRNLIAKNKAPFWLMISGMPVSGDKITKHFGFIAEKISRDAKGSIAREYVKVSDTVTALKNGLSIRALREKPEEYAKELALYADAGKIWISYGIPFMIPLTIGYIFALFGFSVVDIVLSALL